MFTVNWRTPVPSGRTAQISQTSPSRADGGGRSRSRQQFHWGVHRGLNAVAVTTGSDVAAGAAAVAIEAASERTVQVIWSLEAGEWSLYAPGSIDFGLGTVTAPAALLVVLGYFPWIWEPGGAERRRLLSGGGHRALLPLVPARRSDLRVLKRPRNAT